jgi:hypothetical protein
MRSFLLVTLMLFVCVAAPATASAMDVGMQDDQTILYGHHNRDLALDQFVEMGGTHVRINLGHRDSPKYAKQILYGMRTPMKMFDDAIDEIRRRGLEVQLTLTWNRGENPAYIGAWMNNVAEHFGNKVNRYSVFNEPDLSLPLDGTCNGVGQRKLRQRYPSKMVYTYGKWRAKGVLVKGVNVPLETACRQFERGQDYRKIFNESAAAIHAANPRATVLAGETSARPGLEWFVRGTRLNGGLKGADGWAHHPFQLGNLTPKKRYNGWSISQLDKVKRLLKLPVYVTEFGYPHPNSSMDKRVLGRRAKPEEVARALTQSWTLARQAGLKEMLQYQWFRKPDWRTEYWETAINSRDNGSTTLAYRALKRLILSWK